MHILYSNFMRHDKYKTDIFARRAKKEGYPARSIYKLQEIDRKYKIFRKGDRVLDLGCAPGSWLLYVSDRVGVNGKVVGVDAKDIKIRLKSNIVFIKRDVFGLLESGLGELKEKYQVVISDLAPSTSGIKAVDSEKSFELCQEALKIAQKVLLANGNFVCKIFEGKSTKVFIEELEKKLYFVKRFKPKAVSKKSKEFYIIGKNLRVT